MADDHRVAVVPGDATALVGPGATLEHEAGGPVPLPPELAGRLIRIALRTELGQTLWEGYAYAFRERYPWVTGQVDFRPGPGEVVPRTAPPDGRASA